MADSTFIAPGSTATWSDACRDHASDPTGSTVSRDGYFSGSCAARARFRPLSLSFDLGAYPFEKIPTFAVPFERFTDRWGSVRVDPDGARAWNAMPPLIRLDLRYPVSQASVLVFRIGLRRDLSAWDGDPLGLNAPLDADEVDLNEPTLGYFHAENGRFAFRLGRFPVQWSPSPDFGLALSHSVPYHNAAEFALKMGAVRYRFLASSLNPWLEGTPAGDSSGVVYPVGSEEYRQRNYLSGRHASLFHNRVYDSRIKTLFAHRLEGDIGPLSVGLSELQVIGGKPPDLRDAGPFVLFHNDFKEGFANGAVGLDAALRLPLGFALAAEYYIDDMAYGDTETEGATVSLQGWMLGARHAFRAHGWLIGQAAHAVRTDPFLYGYLQPLNTMASRHILASNRQAPGDSVYVDKYVIDYPIGYTRGGDALDFWYRLDAWRGDRIHLAVQAAVLAKGETDLYTPFEEYYEASHDSPSGRPQRETRFGITGRYRLARGVWVGAGAAWQGIRDADHVRGRDLDRARASLSVAWTPLE